jgi:hypothetical protein
MKSARDGFLFEKVTRFRNDAGRTAAARVMFSPI